MKLGLCQMPVTASKTENFATMRRYVRDAAAAGCDLVVLPEMWCCPYSNAAFAQYAEPQGGETWRLLCGSAREYGVWLVAGSVPERDGDAIYNTCYVFDPQGTQQAKHRKVHLFDIDVAGGQRFFESDTLSHSGARGRAADRGAGGVQYDDRTGALGAAVSRAGAG